MLSMSCSNQGFKTEMSDSLEQAHSSDRLSKDLYISLIAGNGY